MKSVLQWTLDRFNFLLKWALNASKGLHGHHLWWQNHLHGLHWTTHLLLVILNECWLHHVDTVFALDFFAVVHQESLVAAKFILNWLNWHLVDGLADLESVKGSQELLGYVKDIFREQGPLWLWVDKSCLCVFLFFLNDNKVSLQQIEFLLQFFRISRRFVLKGTSKLPFLVICVPVEKLWRRVFGHVKL